MGPDTAAGGGPAASVDLDSEAEPARARRRLGRREWTSESLRLAAADSESPLAPHLPPPFLLLPWSPNCDSYPSRSGSLAGPGAAV